MPNFIEELFFGSLDPQRRGCAKDSHIVKVSGNINELEENLTKRLRGEDRDLFLDFCNAYGELTGEAEVDSFITGFCMGARFAYDTFCGNDK